MVVIAVNSSPAAPLTMNRKIVKDMNMRIDGHDSDKLALTVKCKLKVHTETDSTTMDDKILVEWKVRRITETMAAIEVRSVGIVRDVD